MPQIPVLEGASVKPQGVGTPYIDTGAPQGAFGTGLGEAGLQAAHAIEYYGEVSDNIRVNQELTSLDTNLGVLSTEAQMKKGAQSIGVTADTMAKSVTLAKEQTAALANNRQRDRFSQRAQEMLAAQHAGLLRYEGDQAEKLAVDTNVALAATAAETAAKNWTQPEVVAVSLKNAEDAVRTNPQFATWEKPHQDLALADAQSSVYAAILRAQDSQGAHAAFIKTYEAVQGKLNAKDAAEFGAIYKHTADEATVFATADSIYKANSTFDAHGRLIRLDTQKAFDSANEAPPSIRAQVVQETTKLIAEAQHSDDERKKNIVRLGWDLFASGGFHLSAVPMSVQTEIAHFAGELLQQWRTDERIAATEGPEPFEPETWAKWKYLTPEEKQKPENAPERVLPGHVPHAYVKEAIAEVDAINLQQAGLKKDGSPIRTAYSSADKATVDRVIKDSVKLYSIGSTTAKRGTHKANEALADVGRFDEAIWTEATNWHASNPGKFLDDKTVKGFVLNYMAQDQAKDAPTGFVDRLKSIGAAVAGVFAGDTTTLYSTHAPEPPQPTDIPQAERLAITDRLQKGGVPISEDAIQQQYQYDHRMDNVTP